MPDDMISSSSSSFEIVNEESNPIDEFEWENLGMDDSTEDDFSFLELCEDILGSIELIPTVRCYKHLRNPKLNRRLDFAVVFSIAIVAGLGIGNFMGHSSRCSRIRLDDWHSGMHFPHSFPKCFYKHDMTIESEIPKKLHMRLTTPVPLLPGLEKSVAPITVAHEDDSSHLKLKVPTTVAEINVTNEKLDSYKKDTEIVMNFSLPSSAIVNISADSLTMASQIIETNVEKSFDVTVDEMTGSPSHPTYYDVLNLMEDDISDIVLKTRNLIAVMVGKEEEVSFTAMEDMFKRFLFSVEQKSKELREFIDASLFDISIVGKKHFSKLSQVIIKAVDRLMKDSIVKIVNTNKATAEDKLKDVINVGYNIVSELDLHWNNQKQKMHYTKVHQVINNNEYKTPKFYKGKNNRHKNHHDEKFEDKRKLQNEKHSDHKEKEYKKQKKYFKSKRH